MLPLALLIERSVPIYLIEGYLHNPQGPRCHATVLMFLLGKEARLEIDNQAPIALTCQECQISSAIRLNVHVYTGVQNGRAIARGALAPDRAAAR